MDADWVVMWVCITMTVLTALATDAFAKTYDERKAERLAAAKAERRAVEARYQVCMEACRLKCK